MWKCNWKKEKNCNRRKMKNRWISAIAKIVGTRWTLITGYTVYCTATTTGKSTIIACNSNFRLAVQIHFHFWKLPNFVAIFKQSVKLKLKLYFSALKFLLHLNESRCFIFNFETHADFLKSERICLILLFKLLWFCQKKNRHKHTRILLK